MWRALYDLYCISRLVLPIALSGTISCVALAQPEPAPNSKVVTSKVVARVGKVRNTLGSIRCRLYSSKVGFPEESSEGDSSKEISISGEFVTISFEGLAPGTYAVSCIHDENDNKKIDKNFFGAPSEGYGASNNHTYMFSAPKWDESQFTVEAGKQIVLDINLRY